MRVLYLVLGLLAGVYWTSSVGSRVLGNLNDAWELHSDKLATQMYHEGFKRGQAHGRASSMALFGPCFEELDVLREIIHMTVDKKTKVRRYDK